MLVAYDVSPLFGPRTGVGHYAATLLEHLIRADPNLEFRPYAITSKTAGAMPKGLQPVNHLKVPARLGVTLWSLLGKPAAERLTGAADVVHGTNFWLPPLRSHNGILTIHDLAFLLYPELCVPQIQRYRWIVPKALKGCSVVLVPSQTIKDQVASELLFPADRIFVTPEGVRGAFKGASPDQALAFRLGVRGEYVLFAGTQEPRKNLDRLIEAMTSVDKSISLVIAGPAGWGSVDLPALVRHLRLNERVVFCGYLTDTELASLMVGALAFVFPSLYEGFGLPPLEAMAAGIPVVAAKAGALPEVLDEAPYWCDPVDVESIASAIGFAALGADREACIDAGRLVASRYDWDLTAKATLEAYRRVHELSS